MILAEKRVLTEKRNYQNMVIQQKRKVKKNQFHYLRQKRYNRWYYKGFSRKQRLLIIKNKVKRRRLTLQTQKRMINSIARRAFLKRYFIRFARSRVEVSRIKNYLGRYKKRKQR